MSSDPVRESAGGEVLANHDALCQASCHDQVRRKRMTASHLLGMRSRSFAHLTPPKRPTMLDHKRPTLRTAQHPLPNFIHCWSGDLQALAPATPRSSISKEGIPVPASSSPSSMYHNLKRAACMYYLEFRCGRVLYFHACSPKAVRLQCEWPSREARFNINLLPGAQIHSNRL